MKKVFCGAILIIGYPMFIASCLANAIRCITKGYIPDLNMTANEYLELRMTNEKLYKQLGLCWVDKIAKRLYGTWIIENVY